MSINCRDCSTNCQRPGIYCLGNVEGAGVVGLPPRSSSTKDTDGRVKEGVEIKRGLLGVTGLIRNRGTRFWAFILAIT